MNETEQAFAIRELVAVIPAAGQATRISPLPCSKELFPVGFRTTEDGLRPKVVSHYLLEKMKLAGIVKAYIVLRPGKWDIPAYFGDGSLLSMRLAYLMADSSLGVPYTLDQAYPFVRDAIVAFGFPDILFHSEDAFAQLLSRQQTTKADAVLGLFRARGPHETERVDVDEYLRVRQIVIKPAQADLHYTWNIAVWTPKFTSFIHEYLAARQGATASHPPIDAPELLVGNVLQAAIDDHLRIDAVVFANDRFLDIGTPEDLAHAVRNLRQDT